MNNHEAIFSLPEILSFHGVKHIIVSPGSRNAMINIILSRSGMFEMRVVHDERSAGNIALGIAQSTGTPVVCTCTSGSAVQQYGGAFSEAFFQNIPLILLSADRPDEWIDQLDGQTIRQRGILDLHLKNSYHLPVDTSHPDAHWFFERILNEAFLSACSLPFGPVHINLPIREPFYNTLEKSAPNRNKARKIVKLSGTDIYSIPQDLIEIWNNSERKIWIPGQEGKDYWNEVASSIPEDNITVISDIISNCTIPSRIRYHDSFLGNCASDQLQPDLLITTGKSVISKTLKQFIRNFKPKVHWHFTRTPGIQDPFKSVTHIIEGELKTVLSQLNPKKNNQDFTKLWTSFDKKAGEIIAESVKESGELGALSYLLSFIPTDTILHIANSMAIRYLNILNPLNAFEIWSNRGTSGLDTSNGTAVGHALVNGKRNLLITGDTAFLYDLNSFWNINKDSLSLDIFVINNQGGGIFDLIDGPEKAPDGRDFLFASHLRDLSSAAKAYNIDFYSCSSIEEIKEIADTWLTGNIKKGIRIFEYKSDSFENRSSYKSFRKKLNESL